MPVFLSEGTIAHAARGGDGRQEGRECGYYHLHRNLNDFLLHTLFRLNVSWRRSDTWGPYLRVGIVIVVFTLTCVDDQGRGLTRHSEATSVDTVVLSQFNL